MFALGIDPGTHGALATVRFTPAGPVVESVSVPTHRLLINRKVRHRVDLHALWTCFQAVAAGVPAITVLEHVQGYGRQGDRSGQSAAAAFTFGHAAGVLEAYAVACELSLHKVAPAVWKRALGVPADKDGARLTASRLFPRSAHEWQRIKDDGRAEAALLAWYGITKVLGYGQG